MKQSFIYLFVCCFFISCQRKEANVVSVIFVDSLITHYGPSAASLANEADVNFWKRRIDTEPAGFSNEQKYASALSRRFHLYGDIHDLKAADSTVSAVNAELKGMDVGPNLSLAGYAITEHRFREAFDYVQQLKKLGGEKYSVSLLSFDADFELGNNYSPATVLKSIERNQDYGYYFRLSKYQHLKGSLKDAIASMEKAMTLGESNDFLKQAALSNTADLYIHAADLHKAYDRYLECIRLNSSDFHSMMGIGWIALLHDNNDSLAYRIFDFVRSKVKSPDPLFKLYQLSQHLQDSLLQLEYATAFVTQVKNPLYGNMYNKYLVELYTGILHAPEKAEVIAKKELNNRATPQTYAWYVWSLYCNNKKEAAIELYRRTVSGKPLEGLELYWMGKFMQGLNKGYNAKEFFKAAYKNRYDLSPAMSRDLEKIL